jgi:hypothetical protein
MFTPGQLAFALIFLLAFIAVMVRMYRKDRAWHRMHYRGAGWVLVFFLLFIGILLILKYLLKP